MLEGSSESLQVPPRRFWSSSPTRLAQGGQFNLVPYPFGFSSGCQVQLNCTSNGTVFINEFPIQEITPDGLLVNLPTMCGRAVDTISHLYGEHYAPTSTNNILMENCKEKKMSNCAIPMRIVRTQLQITNCSGVRDGYDGNVSCYSGDSTRMFFDYENVTRMGCRFLFSGVVLSEEIGDNLVSVDIQVFKLGWWLKGTCDCSGDADCTKIVSPSDGSDGHRCTCKSGFVGDGYKAGSSCRKVEGMSSIRRSF
ncbi:hypothetical protein Ccrd_021630 [Cynara cardunculus var. scolymus]|uniref:Wall-associated receptor kinase galacturonan-binding domain-containing protein n=1 Tax=Cynara cardunculus var. scolymus TaxID=59895 RepID=A0A103Y093_CYNCS|nr:hypothetical protein Ccrd_021630 [Cynara cardunculus var. scolymus]